MSKLTRSPRVAFVALLLTYLVLAVGYSLADPVYESTDELRHFRYVRHLVVHRSLPVQRIDAPRAQSHHPPLYYALGALVSAWVPLEEDVYYEPPENPFWGYRYWEVSTDNKNQYLHRGDGLFQTSPGHNVTLAVYVVRWMTILIGAGVVWLTYRVGCEVFEADGTPSPLQRRHSDGAPSSPLQRRHSDGARSAHALALGGAALVAFNPQFLYLSGAINNDIPAALCSVAVLWACVRLVRSGPNLRNDVILGVLYGLALLTKFNLLALLAPIGLAYLLAAWPSRHHLYKGAIPMAHNLHRGAIPMAHNLHRGAIPMAHSHHLYKGAIPMARDWQAVLRSAARVAGLAALISGWWFLRNWRLYGDPTGMKQLNELWAGRPATGNWWVIEQSLPYLWSSLWGRFGYGQVPLPQPIYQALLAFCLVSLAGYLVPRPSAVRHPSNSQSANLQPPTSNLQPPTSNPQPPTANRQSLALLGATGLTFVAVVLYYMVIQPAGAMGRFLFPGLPALALILVHGLSRLFRYVRSRILGTRKPRPQDYDGVTQAVSLAVIIGMVALATYALLGVLAPAFARPRPLTASEMESLPNPTEVEFGGLARLLGYQVSPVTVEPGGVVEVTLYWQALDRTDQDYAVFVHLLSRIGTMVAQRDTYPGLGRYPTSAWEPGAAFADTYRVHVPDTAYAPDVGYVQVGMYFPDGPRLTTSDGRDAVRLETVEVRPRAGELPNPLAVRFGDQMMLVGYALDRRVVQPGDTVGLTLYWQAMAPMEVDYRVFAHVLGVQDQVWANSDSELVRGANRTSQWEPGDIVEETRELTVGATTPPDFYDVEVGVYGFDVGRLPVVAEDGHLIHDRVLLSKIQVVDDDVE